ncbi:MAG: hypothetical protein J6R79_02645 [Bacteroidaceae bacterium]|nr:hypothetical protein [Bacteroidaceae bacterium]
MKQLFSSKKWWALDLLICSVWLWVTWHGNWWISLLILFPFFRIWTSLLLHRRSKLAVVPLSVITFYFSVFIFSLQDEFHKLFWDGFRSLAEATNAIFGGNVVEFRACLVEMGNSALRGVIDVVGSLWLWIVPIGLLAYRWYRGELQPLPISKKRAVGLLGYMVAVIIFILLANQIGSYFTIVTTCTCAILGIMWFYTGELKHLLTRSEIVYLSVVGMLGACYFCGVDLHKVGALILYIATLGCYALLSWYWGYQKKLSDMFVLSLSVLCFWFAPTTMGMLRIVLLMLSLAGVAAVCVRFALTLNKKLVGVAMFVLLGVVMPVLSMGYNPYAAVDYKVAYRHRNHSGGVLVVTNGEHRGLRDRYGIIMPVVYDKFTTINRWGPFVQAYNEDCFQIYDIESQRLVSEEWFFTIKKEEDSRYFFRLTSEKGNKRLLLPHWDAGIMEMVDVQIVDVDSTSVPVR